MIFSKKRKAGFFEALAELLMQEKLKQGIVKLDEGSDYTQYLNKHTLKIAHAIKGIYEGDEGDGYWQVNFVQLLNIVHGVYDIHNELYSDLHKTLDDFLNGQW